MLKIGSHVSMSSPEYFLGSVKEALSYEANALMLYTGAPQNSFRLPVEKLRIDEGRKIWEENGCSMKDVIIHAPYIINLGNTEKKETFEIGKEFLKREIKRTEAFGANCLVLHPGSALKASPEESIAQIIEGLDEILSEKTDVRIALETMAGKGSEVGRTFEEIAAIINGCRYSDNLAVCMDSCHIHDGGYNLDDIDDVLKHFDETIGLDRLAVIHVNDSKNNRGAHKDRHANIGEGFIGFDRLYSFVHHPLLDDITKILETPYKEGKAPYKEEIQMLRTGEFSAIE